MAHLSYWYEQMGATTLYLAATGWVGMKAIEVFSHLASLGA